MKKSFNRKTSAEKYAQASKETAKAATKKAAPKKETKKAEPKAAAPKAEVKKAAPKAKPAAKKATGKADDLKKIENFCARFNQLALDHQIEETEGPY